VTILNFKDPLKYFFSVAEWHRWAVVGLVTTFAGNKKFGSNVIIVLPFSQEPRSTDNITYYFLAVSVKS